MADPMMMLSMT